MYKNNSAKHFVTALPLFFAVGSAIAEGIRDEEPAVAISQSHLEGNHDTDSVEEVYPSLQNHHPTIFGLAWNDRDKGYVDIQVSLKYPLWIDTKQDVGLFLAYTHKAAFFAADLVSENWGGSRHSRPVVNMLFNPEIFYRRCFLCTKKLYRGDLDSPNYWELGFVHESNGQPVDDVQSYIALRQQVSLHDEGSTANDYISRSWNSAMLSVHLNLSSRWRLFGKVKFMFDIEDVHEWETENEDSVGIKEIDGVRLAIQYSNFEQRWKSDRKGDKLVLRIISGTEEKVRISSKLLYTKGFGVLYIPPIVFWISYGYDDDLADYFRREWRGGIGIELLTFPHKAGSVPPVTAM